MSKTKTTETDGRVPLRGPRTVEILPLHEPPVDWHRVHNVVNDSIKQHEWYKDDLRLRFSLDVLFPSLFYRIGTSSFAVVQLEQHVDPAYAYGAVRQLVYALQERGWVCNVNEFLVLYHPKHPDTSWWERLRPKLGHPWLLT